LDPDGDREKFRSAVQRKLLRARAHALDDVDVCVRSEIARTGFIRRGPLLRRSRFSDDEIAEALLCLQRGNQIIIRGNVMADVQTWQTLRARTVAFIDNA